MLLAPVTPACPQGEPETSGQTRNERVASFFSQDLCLPGSSASCDMCALVCAYMYMTSIYVYVNARIYIYIYIYICAHAYIIHT